MNKNTKTIILSGIIKANSYYRNIIKSIMNGTIPIVREKNIVAKRKIGKININRNVS